MGGEEWRDIVQPSEFIVGRDGRVVASSYSSGPLGRIDAPDVACSATALWRSARTIPGLLRRDCDHWNASAREGRVTERPHYDRPDGAAWGAADQFQKIEYGERFARDLSAPLRRIEGDAAGARTGLVIAEHR